MKILLCSRNELDRRLGASKVPIELHEALVRIGVDATLIGPEHFAAGRPGERGTPEADAEALRDYLVAHAGEYDVVDYDHDRLPYPRKLFAGNTLMVARSVLLGVYAAKVKLPPKAGFRGWIGRLLFGRRRQRALTRSAERAYYTLSQADLVNVSNEDDRRELAGRGMDPGKIIVLPYALSRQRLEELQTCPVEPPSGSVVAFVGTFDMRKGCRDFPTLVDRVVGQVADARFRLVGTKGLFASAEEVLQHFPAKHRSRIEVIPRFDPVRLPELLSDCSLGVFPSYFEGFPFGVLEMLAANLPVVAYDAPGPPMMLTKEYLVPVGNPAALAERVVSLLQDRRRLASARLWAGQRARTFDWDQVARDTVARYLERVQQLRSDLQSPRTC